MIDKIEAMIEPSTRLRGDLNDLWRASPWDTLSPVVRPSKYYEAVADLRPFGFDAMLHMKQKRYGTHKVELFETGKKSMAEIHGTIERIVDCDPAGCRLGRIDLATDVRDVSLSWFREHAYVQYKQFLCAHSKMVEDEQTEMGKKVYQTLYFGKRPSCVRIYDKTAERISHYELWKKRQVRAAKRENMAYLPQQRPELVLPTFAPIQDWLATELPEIKHELAFLFSQPEPKRFPIVTRVENQFGGRVPEALATLGQVRKNIVDFNPFARMKILNGTPIPPSIFDKTPSGGYRFGVLQWFASIGVRQAWKTEGAQVAWSMLNRDRNGRKFLDQMPEFMPADDDGSVGISELELHSRYRESISRQLAA